MRTDALPTYLERLAARVPAPGGGAAAGVHAAQAAALVAMLTGRAGALAPVPGGVGPVTTALLLRHTVDAARSALRA